jgi:hypothetical protein
MPCYNCSGRLPLPRWQVHTSLANAECVRTHSGIVANLTWAPAQPPLWARLFHLSFQVGPP